jgi:hypothetical protein
MTDRDAAVIEAARKTLAAVEQFDRPPYHEDEVDLAGMLMAGAWESGLVGLHDAAVEAFAAIRTARDELRAALASVPDGHIMGKPPAESS